MRPRGGDFIDRYYSLSRKIIFPLLVVFLIFLLVLNIFIKNHVDILREKLIGLNQTSLENISRNYISQELKHTERIFDHIYSELDGRPLTEESIGEYYERWEAYLNLTEGTSFIYLGTDSGGLYARPEYIPDDKYQTVERPWYQISLENQDRKNWLIYEDYIDGHTLLSLSRRIELGNNSYGVLGIDVSEEQISHYLSEIIRDSQGEMVFLMSECNCIYRGPEDPQIDESILARLNSLSPSSGMGYFTQGEWYVFHSSVYIEGWKLVKLVKRVEVERELYSYIWFARIFFILEILIGAVIITCILYRMKRVLGRDSLTGLKNRGLFDQLLRRADRDRGGYSIIFLDIDDFKRINDIYGHQTGDVVLKRIGALIESLMDTEDRAYRYGGEEFVIHSTRSREEVYELGEKIRKEVESLQWREAFRITISVGIAVSGRDKSSMVLKRADDLLYRSKRSGKNMVSLEG